MTEQHKGIFSSRLKPKAEVSAVVFDWDATLATSLEATLKALKASMGAAGLVGYPVEIPGLDKEKTLDDMTVKDLEKVKHENSTKFLKKLYTSEYPGEKGEKIFRRTKHLFDQARAPIHKDAARLLFGASDTLRELTDRGIPVAIVSNKEAGPIKEQTEKLLTEFRVGYEDNFHPSKHEILAMGRIDDEKGKPHGDRYYSALEKLGVKPDK